MGIRQKTCFYVCALFVLLALPSPAMATRIDGAVSELLSRSLLKIDCSATLKVGLWHFDKTKVPVSENGGRRIYDEVTAALVDRAPRCMSVLDSVGVGAIMTHLHRSGALSEKGGNVIAALTESHEGVDVVVFPDLYLQNNKLILTMRSVEAQSGRTLSQTAPFALDDDYLTVAAGDEAKPLDLSLREAADVFEAHLTKATDLQVQGVYFEESGAQPAAGRAILDGLLAEITTRSRERTGNILKTRGIKLSVTDGAQTSAVELSAEQQARAAGQPLLSGRYWVLDGALDVTLSLALPEGVPVVWRGRIRKDDFGGLAVRPQNEAVVDAKLPDTSLSFQVTTERGSSPQYHPGETLELVLRSGEEVRVYCYYLDSEKQVFPLLPYSRVQQENGRNKLPANTAVKFPDPARDSVELKFTDATLGEEMITCFASQADLSEAIDPSVVPGSVEAVPLLTLKQLRSMFQRITGGGVAESNVTITLTQN